MVGTVASGQREMVRVTERDRVADCVAEGEDEVEMDTELEAQSVLVTVGENVRVGEPEGDLLRELVAHFVLVTVADRVRRIGVAVDDARLEVVTVNVSVTCQSSSKKKSFQPPLIMQQWEVRRPIIVKSSGRPFPRGTSIPSRYYPLWQQPPAGPPPAAPPPGGPGGPAAAGAPRMARAAWQRWQA